MIHAYDKNYLEKARISLGRMLDFAVYDLNYTLADFWEVFLSSEIVEKFEYGESSILVGKSGIELAYEVLNDAERKIKPRFTENRSIEYWTGWAIAYLQWQTSLSFKEITRYISIDEVARMYFPYHEMDIRQFSDKMMELYHERKGETNLKRRRKEVGLSQRELAEQTGVPLRTIQQYEQGQKSINNARAEYVVAFSKALYCKTEDLLES